MANEESADAPPAVPFVPIANDIEITVPVNTALRAAINELRETYDSPYGAPADPALQDAIQHLLDIAVEHE